MVGGEVYRGTAGEVGYLPLPDPEERHDGLGPFEHAAGVAPRVLLSPLGEDAVVLAAVRPAVQAVEERLFGVAPTEAV